MFTLQGETKKIYSRLRYQRMADHTMNRYLTEAKAVLLLDWIFIRLFPLFSMGCLILCSLTAPHLHQLFADAADVLRKIGEDGRVIQEFVDLGTKAKIAASEAMDIEAALGDIPDEFLDPIQVLLILNLNYRHVWA